MIDPEILKPFRPELQEAIQDFTETLQTFAVGKRAITIGGSTGKGIFDSNSDLDFRIFHERELLWPDKDPEPWKPIWAKVAKSFTIKPERLEACLTATLYPGSGAYQAQYDTLAALIDELEGLV
jgi:hypothetical protein